MMSSCMRHRRIAAWGSASVDSASIPMGRTVRMSAQQHRRKRCAKPTNWKRFAALHAHRSVTEPTAVDDTDAHRFAVAHYNPDAHLDDDIQPDVLHARP